MTPVTVSRSERERVLVEASINAVRVSIAIKQVQRLSCANCRLGVWILAPMADRRPPFRVLCTVAGR